LTPIKDAVVGGGGSPIGAFNPHGSIVVVMKSSSTSATFFLERASFCKTTLQKFLQVFWKKKLVSFDLEI